jgi:Clp amino terminal domain, pathogenicity island component
MNGPSKTSKSSNARRSGDDYHPWSTYIVAREEARRRGDRKVGTEHLLVALLSDPVLASTVGSDAQHARTALDAMDSAALVAIGMDAPPKVPPLPTRDPRAVPARPTLRTVLRKRLALTPGAKHVLRESSKGMRRGHAHPGPQHVLATILELRAPDPAADLLAALDVQPTIVRERLADA